MQTRTKHRRQGGRPRKFDKTEALGRMQRRLWTTGLSGASLDSIARSAGINRPSLAAAFGDKDAIYAQTAAQYVEMIDERLREALSNEDLEVALTNAFDAAIETYTGAGPDGCFIICTAPAEALTNPACRKLLDQSLNAIDALFLERLKKQEARIETSPSSLPILATQLGAALHSLALRARAGWSRGRLRKLASGMIRQVLASLGHSQ
jgi:TetR/AcrR family transcriptional regulator, copper-responsive repressor